MLLFSIRNWRITMLRRCLEKLARSHRKVWYLAPLVYHAKKKRPRVVFDCAASYQGVSLNTELLQGPDMTNSLVGVILRFRKEPTGIMADVDFLHFFVVATGQHWPNPRGVPYACTYFRCCILPKLCNLCLTKNC